MNSQNRPPRSKFPQKHRKNGGNFRSSKPPNSSHRSRKKSGWLWALLKAFAFAVAFCTIGLLYLFWKLAHLAPTSKALALEISPELSDPIQQLEEARLIEDAWLWRLLYRGTRLVFSYGPAPEGQHWLHEGVRATELPWLLQRRGRRPSLSLKLLEGQSSYEWQEQLQKAGIVSSEAFRRAIERAEIERSLAVEGYLFPDNYEFYYNSSGEEVLQKLLKHGQKQHLKIQKEVISIQSAKKSIEEFGWDGVVRLASVVEKESTELEDARLVASVFLNRLRSDSFRPKHRLQSDPTAAYGCKKPNHSEIPSCAEFDGKHITPAMLKDAKNPYNSYLKAGLPPSAISNPRERGLRAVLPAPPSEFYYFVSTGQGKHRFSKDFAAHQAGVEALRSERSGKNSAK